MMEEICRLCLITDVELYSLDKELLGQCFVLSSHNEMNEQYLPNFVCSECKEQLRLCCDLQRKYSTATEYLLKIYYSNKCITKELVNKLNRSELNFKSSLYIDNIPNAFDNEDTKFNFKSCEDFTNEDKFLKSELDVDDDYMAADYSEGCTSEDDYLPLMQAVKVEKTKHSSLDKKESKRELRSNSCIETENERPIKKADCSVRVKKKTKRKVLKEKSKKEKNTSEADDDGIKDHFDIVSLTPEQQIDYWQSLKDSPAYRDALYKCEVCFRTYINPGAYKEHLNHHDSIFGEFECPVCKLRYISKQHVDGHIYTAHATKYHCKLCPKVCNTLFLAKKHYRRHSGYQYKCETCDFSSIYQSSLVKHRRLKHPSKYSCAECGLGFNSERGLALHTTKTHSDKVKLQVGKYSCDDCLMTFQSKRSLQSHVSNTKHQTRDIKLACARCGEVFPDNKSLQSHQRSKHATKRVAWSMPGDSYPMQCEYCNETVSNRREHYFHVRKRHPKERDNYRAVITAVCDTCGKGFQNATKLHLHELRHRGTLSVPCPHCPRMFFDKYQLGRHVGVHCDERPFQCTQCDKTFKLRSNFNRHAKVHSGVLAYECTMCGKRFRYSSSRNLHIRTVHYKIPPPPRKKKRTKTRNSSQDDV